MIDRQQAGDRAVLVHPHPRGDLQAADREEFVTLARSADIEVCAVVDAPRERPDAAYFVGSGKVDEIAEQVQLHEADLVLFNQMLSPVQERNLEKRLHCRVHDRTTLILDIFAQRARSHEGKLQVELAQLRHLATRLVRGWTHLERQKGGIGLRGPGETQLETDRRLLAERVKYLDRRLDKVSRQREASRRGRQRAGVSVATLVGYTNAGKSTLFNALTDAGVMAEDKLFATLDPTLRKLSDGLVIADTVGFIRNLPHELVAAFKSTLQEASDADLLVHVVDAADPERREYIAQVNAVLEEIGAGRLPVLTVYNKIDLLDAEPRVERDSAGRPTAVWVSAAKDRGLELLQEAIEERVSGRRERRDLSLTPAQGRLRARLHEWGVVDSESVTRDGHWEISVRVDPEQAGQIDRWMAQP